MERTNEFCAHLLNFKHHRRIHIKCILHATQTERQMDEKGCRMRDGKCILWHISPLLGEDREVGDCTVSVAKQRPVNNIRIVS
jgi:hypothetical protein